MRVYCILKFVGHVNDRKCHLRAAAGVRSYERQAVDSTYTINQINIAVLSTRALRNLFTRAILCVGALHKNAHKTLCWPKEWTFWAHFK